MIINVCTKKSGGSEENWLTIVGQVDEFKEGFTERERQAESCKITCVS